MKLTKDTKQLVKPGMYLKDTCDMYEVVGRYEWRNTISLTLRGSDGRIIYGMPISRCYGMRIIGG